MGMCKDGNCPECQESRAKALEAMKNNPERAAEIRMTFADKVDSVIRESRPQIKWTENPRHKQSDTS